MTDIAVSPEAELANLQAIADELAHRPGLELWAVQNHDIAGYVGDIHKLYPWLPPGVTLALGSARYAPDDPFVKSLSDQVLALGRKANYDAADLQRSSLQGAEMQRSLDTSILGTALPGEGPHGGGGFFDRAVGDIGGAVGAAAHAVGSVIPDVVRSDVKGVSRVGFAAAQSGLEGVEAGYRALDVMTRGLNNPSQQTREHPSLVDRLTGANEQRTPESPLPQITLTHIINGEGSGSGFFPGGPAAQNTRAAQFLADNAGGHALTIGRGIAGSVLQPNSKPYGLVSGLADVGVALYGDPAQLALSGAGDLAAARRAVAEPGTHWGDAGGIWDQLRQTIGIRTATEQLNTRAGAGIIQKLADTNDFTSMWHLMGDKVDGQILAELTHANSPEAVRAILDRELGTGIENLPTWHPRLQAMTQTGATDDFGNPLDKGLGNIGYAIDRTTRGWRPMANLGGGLIHTDLSVSWARNENIRNAEAFLMNARVEPAVASATMEKFATATNRVQLYDAFKEMTNTVADHLTREFDIPKAKAREMTRGWSSFSGEGRDTYEHFVAELSDKMTAPGLMVDGKPLTWEGPHLPTEMLQNNIALPDMREIRRASSDYRKFVTALGSGGVRALALQDWGTSALDAFMHVWKGAQLIRPALMVRILGESQLAMAAGGDASLFRHPLDWIGYVTGHKGATDITEAEHLFSPSDYNQVMKVGTGQVAGFDPERMWTGQWTQILRGQNGFTSSWAQEVRHMHLDPLARATAAAMVGGEGPGARTVDELKDAFFSGHLRQLRVDMTIPNGALWQASLGVRAESDRYIDSVVGRIRTLTRDDPEILQSIADGNFRGSRLATLKDGKQVVGRGAYERPPQALTDRLGELMDGGDSPRVVKGFLMGQTKLGPGAVISQTRDKMMGRMFDMLVGQPVQRLAASPHFRQAYFREVDKLLPYMDPAEAAKVVERAGRAGIDGLDASRAAGTLNANMVDTIAKSRSLNSMKDLLHDLSHRSQASDMLRFVAPFGDAWKKVITRWAKIISENPATLERFRQGMNEGTQSGFVHTNEFGQRVFTIPFSQQIDQLVAGTPFPMSAPLNGLNIVGSGLPGIGPAVSVPLGLIAPHVPLVQDILTKIAPYGVPNVQQGALEAFFPGWLQRFRTAGLVPGFGASPDQQSTFMHAVDEVLRYGVSAGKYDMSTPQGIQQAVGDARNKAKSLYAIRGLMQFVSPSPPSMDAMVKDKSGRLTAAYVLANQLQNLYQGKGIDGKGHTDPSQATKIFLRLYGNSNYLMLQPFTTPRRYGLPTTVGAASWLVSHPGFAKTYPNVYGVLVPQKGTFDYALYQGQLHSGERVDRTPDEYLRLANARLAAMIYDDARNQLPDDASSADKSNYLAWLRDRLVKQYPGYQDASLDESKIVLPQAIAELGTAAADPAVRNSDAARGVRAYLALRQEVIDWEKQNGSNIHANALSTSVTDSSFLAANQWLSAQASRLITLYPSFLPAWDNVLSRELKSAPTANPAGV